MPNQAHACQCNANQCRISFVRTTRAVFMRGSFLSRSIPFSEESLYALASTCMPPTTLPVKTGKASEGNAGVASSPYQILAQY